MEPWCKEPPLEFGWLEWWKGVVLDGMKIANGCASSFPLESSERVKMNVDTGAAVNTFPLNFGLRLGDGSFYDWIPDGEAWRKWFAQISEWKSHECTLSVVQHCISICSSTSIRSCRDRDRVRRTTGFLRGTRCWYIIPIHMKIR